MSKKSILNDDRNLDVSDSQRSDSTIKTLKLQKISEVIVKPFSHLPYLPKT